jgi:hypothetical protein
MNAAHFHIMINHFPVIGIIFVFLISVVALRWDHPVYRKIAFGFALLLALSVIPVFLSGDQAEETLKAMAVPDIKGFIGPHARAATLTSMATIALGIPAILGLFLKKIPTWLMPVQVVVSLVLVGMFGLTALLGGAIRHTEIRQDAITQQARSIPLGGKKRPPQTPPPQKPATDEE